VELVFYDTTSLHFEVDEEDQGVGEADLVRGSQPAGAKLYPAPRKRGYAKNGRGDVPQIVVGMAVTRDGFPVRHWVFPGNTVDVTTVAKVKEDLRGWQLSRCVFVGDAGMVSQDNLRRLSLGGGKYIVCMPIHQGGEVAKEVLARPGRYQEVAENLRVKQVEVGDGERRRRYVVCHNPQEQTRQQEHRAKVLAELEAELASLADSEGGPHSKRACQLRASGRYGKYLKQSKTGKLSIAKAKVRAAERGDGKFVVHSNDDTLNAEDLALGYKQLMRVEEAWRTLKSGLKLRPVFHWAPHRIHAHVALTVLSLLLERVAEHACQDTWRNIRDDLKQIKLAQLSSPHGDVWQVTQPRSEARNRLKSLTIKNPPEVLRLA
jgi:transposase